MHCDFSGNRDGSTFALFFSELEVKKDHFLNSKEFKNKLLQQRITEAKNHGAFNNEVIEGKKKSLARQWL